MPTGFEAYLPSGVQTIGLTSSIAKFLGITNIGQSYTGNSNSGSFTDSRFTAYSGHTPFVQQLNAFLDTEGNFPTFSFSGSTLNWVFPRGGTPAEWWTRPDTSFVYGIA